MTQDAAGADLGPIGHFFAPGVYAGRPAIRVLLDFYGRTGRNPFNYPSGVVVRTATARAVHGYDPTMRHVGDLDFFCRLMLHGDLALTAETGCRVTLHKAQTGTVQAAQPIGMRELQVMLRKFRGELLTDPEHASLSAQYRSLAMLHALRLLRQGRGRSFANYVRFATEDGSQYPRLMAGAVRILRDKLKARPAGANPWQSRLDQRF
jgi:hypothetical protein